MKIIANQQLIKILIRATPNNLILLTTNYKNELTDWTSSGSLKLPSSQRRINHHLLIMLLERKFDIWKRRQVVIHTLAFYGKKIAKRRIAQLFVRNKLPVLNLIDRTKPPHNGCRLVKRRRK